MTKEKLCINALMDKVERLEEEIRELKSTIIPFDEVSLDHITQNNIVDFINNPTDMVVNIAKKTYVDINNKRYHSIYIPSIRRPYAMAYNGSKWIVIDGKQAIETIYKMIVNFMIGQFSYCRDQFDAETRQRFQYFTNTKYTKAVMNPIKKSIKLMLYNNKDIVINTKKTLHS